LHVFPKFFSGKLPQIFGQYYKAHPDSDRVEKFHGKQPSKLGDPVAKEIKETSAVKH